MKRTVLRPALFSCLLLVALAAWTGRSGATPPTPVFPDVIGLWTGEFTSASGATGSASLSITAQDQFAFLGTFTFVPPNPLTPPSPCFVLGAVSESGDVALAGENEDFSLEALGTVSEGAMLLDYHVLFADGSFDMGTVAISTETIVVGEP